MKKILLFASALVGFSVMAQAQETTIKTTTVQYQVPTCSNCRTTTQVRTVYPEPEPACTTCGQQPIVAAQQPIVMKRKTERKFGLVCQDNHELGIRNPLFRLKQGQVAFDTAGRLAKEPKRDKRVNPSTGRLDFRAEYDAWQWSDRLGVGLTDRWSMEVFGGHQFSRMSTKHGRLYREQTGRAVPHNNRYNVSVGTYYHLLDFCHFDAIVGLEGTWGRNKTKQGSSIRRTTSLSWDPTITIGSNLGWFTPYLTASYQFTHTHMFKNQAAVNANKKTWEDDHGYVVTPGLYFQPSKYVGFDFHILKVEDVAGEWNVGVDFYPYKNVSLGMQLNARRPFKDPMQMYGVGADAKIVF